MNLTLSNPAVKTIDIPLRELTVDMIRARKRMPRPDITKMVCITEQTIRDVKEYDHKCRRVHICGDLYDMLGRYIVPPSEVVYNTNIVGCRNPEAIRRDNHTVFADSRAEFDHLHSRRPIYGSIKFFKQMLYNQHPFLIGMDWHGIIMAGGMVSRILKQPRTGADIGAGVGAGVGISDRDCAEAVGSDIDMFFHSLSDDEIVAKIDYVIGHIKQYRAPGSYNVSAAYNVSATYRTANAVTLCITLDRNSIRELEYTHPLRNSIHRRGTIQFVTRAYNTPSEVIHAFDLGSSACLFDGQSVYLTLNGLLAYEYRTNYFDPTVYRANYEERVDKYLDRGFMLCLPFLHQSISSGPSDNNVSSNNVSSNTSPLANVGLRKHMHLSTIDPISNYMDKGMQIDKITYGLGVTLVVSGVIMAAFSTAPPPLSAEDLQLILSSDSTPISHIVAPYAGTFITPNFALPTIDQVASFLHPATVSIGNKYAVCYDKPFAPNCRLYYFSTGPMKTFANDANNIIPNHWRRSNCCKCGMTRYPSVGRTSSSYESTPSISHQLDTDANSEYLAKVNEDRKIHVHQDLPLMHSEYDPLHINEMYQNPGQMEDYETDRVAFDLRRSPFIMTNTPLTSGLFRPTIVYEIRGSTQRIVRNIRQTITGRMFGYSIDTKRTKHIDMNKLRYYIPDMNDLCYVIETYMTGRRNQYITTIDPRIDEIIAKFIQTRTDVMINPFTVTPIRDSIMFNTSTGGITEAEWYGYAEQ